MANFRVWRDSGKRFDYFTVGENAELLPSDTVQLGSGFETEDGTEVFEGDIVTGDSLGTKDNVVFSCGCFCLANAMMHYEATYWGSEITVVGNIFEGDKSL